MIYTTHTKKVCVHVKNYYLNLLKPYIMDNMHIKYIGLFKKNAKYLVVMSTKMTFQL